MIQLRRRFFIKIPNKCILKLVFEIKLSLKIHQIYENLIIIFSSDFLKKKLYHIFIIYFCK